MRRTGWLVGLGILTAALAGCEGDPFGDGCGEFSGGACEQVVECCQVAASDDPQGEAAKRCDIDRKLAEQLVESGKPNDSQCNQMRNAEAYQEACFSCPTG